MNEPLEDEEGEHFIGTHERRLTAHVCSEPKCSDGTTQHKWDGPVVMRGRMGSMSCSNCGVLAFDVDNFMGGA